MAGRAAIHLQRSVSWRHRSGRGHAAAAHHGAPWRFLGPRVERGRRQPHRLGAASGCGGRAKWREAGHRRPCLPRDARAQVRHIRILRESGRFQLETGGNAENSVEQLLNAHIGIPLVNTRDDGDAVMMTAPLPPAGGSVVCSSDSGDLVEKISEAVRPFGLARHPPPRRTDTPRTAPSGGAQHDGRRNGPQP